MPILRVTDRGGLYAEKQAQINIAECSIWQGVRGIDFNTGAGFRCVNKCLQVP